VETPAPPPREEEVPSSPPQVRRPDAPLLRSEGAKTVAMRRRLFRAPRPSGEPTADALYLGLIADKKGSKWPGSGKASSTRVRRSKRASRSGKRAAGELEWSEEEDSEEDDDDEYVPSESPARSDDDDDDRSAESEDQDQEGGASSSSSSSSSSTSSSSSSSSSGASRAPAGSSSQDGGDDVYEVDAILDEDDDGGRGLLIRWAGYGPEHDSWEPECHVAPQLVSEFREGRRLARSHQGADYKQGSRKLLWCARCRAHQPSDSFSANMRRAEPLRRQCLIHHYGAWGGASTRTPDRKRARDGEDASSSVRPSPRAPVKKARPVVRAMTHRQASQLVARSRLFGF